MTITLEEKLKVAGWLPEQIIIYRNPQFPSAPSFLHKEPLQRFQERIRDTEWHCLVALVEEKLNPKQFTKYVDSLCDLVGGDVYNNCNIEELFKLTLSQRISALSKILK